MDLKLKLSLLQIFLAGVVIGTGIAAAIYGFLHIFGASVLVSSIAFYLGVKDID